MGIDLTEDLKRKLIELNLNAARLAQSPQTGYLHLNYESEERQDTIPLLENFCFALALMRSRLADQIIEGKALLEKLLVFEVEGNFPVYLHDFPQCKDRVFSLNILPIFHWILKDFRSALNESLAVHLEMLIFRILSHAYKMHGQRPLSKAAEFRLKSYFEPNDLPAWLPSSSEEWADALITYQMAYSNGLDLSNLLKEALKQWNPHLGVYLGVQQQERGEPKPTLFDLLMGHYHHNYSRRALEARSLHLLAALIQPFEQKSPQDLSSEILCHVLTANSCFLYWGSLFQLHSLMFDASHALCSSVKDINAMTFYVSLPQRTFQEGEEVFETRFFFNLHPDHQIRIRDAKASTFQMGEPVELISNEQKMTLQFDLVEGDGRFFGHISRANRPNQRGKNLKFEVFDWQIALRTIRRSENCSLKITLKT